MRGEAACSWGRQPGVPPRLAAGHNPATRRGDAAFSQRLMLEGMRDECFCPAFETSAPNFTRRRPPRPTSSHAKLAQRFTSAYGWGSSLAASSSEDSLDGLDLSHFEVGGGHEDTVTLNSLHQESSPLVYTEINCELALCAVEHECEPLCRSASCTFAESNPNPNPNPNPKHNTCTRRQVDTQVDADQTGPLQPHQQRDPPLQIITQRCTTQLKQRTHRAPKPKHPDQH